MKIKIFKNLIKKFSLFALLFFITTFLFTGQVSAAPLSYIDDTNFLLTTPSITVTVSAGSKADGFVVIETNVAVTMSNTTGGTFTLTSPKAMTSSVTGSGGTLTQICSGGIETETITQISSSATYTLTPITSACTATSPTTVSGGGPLITGSNYIYVPPTTPPPIANPTTPPPTNTPVTTICPVGNLFSTSTGLPCTSFQNITTSQLTTPSKTNYNFGTVTLRNGSRGEAVKELQRFLNNTMKLGLVVDGRLGPKTIAVIKKWQKDHGLVADGLVGVKTKVMMNAEVK